MTYIHFALMDVSLSSVCLLIRGTPGVGRLTKVVVVYEPFSMLLGLKSSLISSSSEEDVDIRPSVDGTSTGVVDGVSSSITITAIDS